MPVPLIVELRDGGRGDVYVEVRGKRPFPVAALEHTYIQFWSVQERHTKLWLPLVSVGVPHLYRDPAAPWLGLRFEGASALRYFDISGGSAERRLLGLLLEQGAFRVVWPIERVEVSREQPDMREWLPKVLTGTEDLDAETWEEAVYTVLCDDPTYTFGDRRKAGWGEKPHRRRRNAETTGPIATRASGDLPTEDPPTVTGVALPEGSRSPAGGPPHPLGAEDVLWSSDTVVADAVSLAASLADRFPETGLWPCVWPGFDNPASYCRASLRDGEPADADPAAVLAELWDFPAPPPHDAVDPFIQGFPGLAVPTADGAAANPFRVLADRSRPLQRPEDKLVLVPCLRPADVLTAIGFECGSEGSSAANDVSLLVAVLRSWEERFHAFLVRLVPGGLTLAVGSPPETLEHALEVAAELYAFAPGEEGARPGVLRELANTLVRNSAHPVGSPYVWELGWPS
jgi:Domain of unknown function (DUF4253)